MNTYKQQYREIEVIGKGNFGSATLVQRTQPNQSQQVKYLNMNEQLLVAKKIVLDKLSEKERQGALRESELLKSLRHPNIVSYVDSFIHDGTLIIIMEHCEEGDLSYHIKRRKQMAGQLQYFPEKLILNWFLQILFALQYIHHKRILHRDIKSSNIFLTSNGTVKIGDFGISKVLENTLDQASTVVGTPYYMSPEVCENKPYTFKSDVWALGCVLYELCTLKHAFDANNLLGLIFKIMREQIDHIPSIYSKDLQALIQYDYFLLNEKSKLLSKSATVRPVIVEIINLPFIQNTMQEFVISGGRQSYITVKESKAIKPKQEQEEVKEEEERKDDPEQTLQTVVSMVSQVDNASRFTMGDTINSQQQNQTLTPKERLRLRKEQEVLEKQQQLKQVTQQLAVSNRNEAELRKIQHIHGTGSQFYQQLNLDMSLKGESVFVRADTPVNKIQALMESDQWNMMQSSLMSLKQKQSSKPPVPEEEEQYSESFEDEAYEDDFEPYEEEDEEEQPQTQLKAAQSQRDLDEVLNLYRNELARVQTNSSIDELESSVASVTDSQENGSKQQSQGQERIISNLRANLMAQLGIPLFKQVYSYMKLSRSNEVDDPTIRKELMKMVGKQNMNACFNIDQLIYWEQQLYA